MDEDGEPTNKGNDTGKNPDNVSKEDVTPADKVKADLAELKKTNDAYDAEKLRSEKARAEIARGGRSDGGTGGISKEEEFEKKAKDEADGIVAAFR